MACIRKTKVRVRTIALAAIAGALCTSTSVAHHGSSASYDTSKRLTVAAVVTEFRYANPHPQLFYDVVDASGGVTHWSAELWTNPSFLLRAGWNKARSIEALQPGTVVTLTYAPSRASSSSALIYRIQNEQGEEVVHGPPRL